MARRVRPGKVCTQFFEWATVWGRRKYCLVDHRNGRIVAVQTRTLAQFVAEEAFTYVNVYTDNSTPTIEEMAAFLQREMMLTPETSEFLHHLEDALATEKTCAEQIGDTLDMEIENGDTDWRKLVGVNWKRVYRSLIYSKPEFLTPLHLVGGKLTAVK